MIPKNSTEPLLTACRDPSGTVGRYPEESSSSLSHWAAGGQGSESRGPEDWVAGQQGVWPPGHLDCAWVFPIAPQHSSSHNSFPVLGLSNLLLAFPPAVFLVLIHTFLTPLHKYNLKKKKTAAFCVCLKTGDPPRKEVWGVGNERSTIGKIPILFSL